MNKMLIGVIRAQLRFTVDNFYGFHKTFVHRPEAIFEVSA